MKRVDKVVWSEGLFLTPHLFQQGDRYHESLLDFRLKPMGPFFWGLLGLEIDREVLPSGQVAVSRCSGILPDGMPIQIPDTDAPPESRSIKAHFPPSADSLSVYLAIPTDRPGSLNYRTGGEAGGRPLRYQAELTRVADETAEGNELEIPVARKDFRILFAGESLDDAAWIKIAEVARGPSGSFVLEESYVPPVVALSASPRLMAIHHRLLELLSSRSNTLSQQRRHVSDFGASDIANFWLLHTINSSIPVLTHFFKAPDRHPEQLYAVLAQLAGELSTFALQVDPRDLPPYDHANLGVTFGELEKKIALLLETVLPIRYVMIPLEKTPELLYIGRIHDERLIKTARFYLGANAQIPAGRLIEEIPAKAKISSPDQINSIIGRAIRGVELTHEPVPPSAIPVKTGFKYFHLSTQGRSWDAIGTSKALAIYVPDDFPDLRLELVALRE
jgi:type VI secretion system protein ImpJ